MLSRRLLFPAFALTAVAAAATLAYLGANSAAESESLTTESLITNTARLAEEKIDRIERKLIDTENVLFDLMSGVDEAVFLQRWDDYVGPSPFAKAVVLLGPEGEILARVTTRKDQEREKYFTLLNQRIVPDLEVGQWPVGMLKHLHARYEGQYYLFAYQTRQVQGRKLSTVIEIDMDNVLGDIFPKTFNALQKEFRYTVIDQSSEVIYGEPFEGGGPYTKSVPFPTTLYRWRLVLAPEQATALLFAAEQRVALRYELFGLAALILLLGLLGAGYATTQERRLAALKAEFVANVSHELKTPLSLIRMFSEMLRIGPARDEKKTREYLDIIYRESERLAMLIENVLDFSRFKQGKSQRPKRPLELDDLARRAAESLQPRLQQSSHRLRLSLDPIPTLHGDPDALLLAIQNLIDNAAKFAEEPCEISLTTKVESSEALLLVEDTGPGIFPEELPHIFERFFRGKRQGRRPVRGSGIGLSLVKSIVTQHKGTIIAESELGRGSRFTIRLPLKNS